MPNVELAQALLDSHPHVGMSGIGKALGSDVSRKVKYQPRGWY